MNTKSYELTYLISPDLSEEEVQVLVAKITNSIRDEGGSVTNTSNPSKINLGYSVGKKAVAFLVTTYFSSEAEKISNLETIIGEQSNILRSTILVRKQRKEKPKRIKKTEAPLEIEKVDLDKIDQQIDQQIEDILQ